MTGLPLAACEVSVVVAGEVALVRTATDTWLCGALDLEVAVAGLPPAVDGVWTLSPEVYAWLRRTVPGPVVSFTGPSRGLPAMRAALIAAAIYARLLPREGPSAPSNDNDNDNDPPLFV